MCCSFCHLPWITHLCLSKGWSSCTCPLGLVTSLHHWFLMCAKQINLNLNLSWPFGWNSSEYLTGNSDSVFHANLTCSFGCTQTSQNAFCLSCLPISFFVHLLCPFSYAVSIKKLQEQNECHQICRTRMAEAMALALERKDKVKVCHSFSFSLFLTFLCH